VVSKVVRPDTVDIATVCRSAPSDDYYYRWGYQCGLLRSTGSVDEIRSQVCKGDSGGPVFHLDSQGRADVVGVTRSGSIESGAYPDGETEGHAANICFKRLQYTPLRPTIAEFKAAGTTLKINGVDP